jgi:hypothetical protein
MLYVKFENGRPVSATTEHQSLLNYQSRWDWHKLGFAHVQRIAELLSQATGKQYVATDTPGTAPQFDVIEMPKVGDEVSYSFNGDTTPCGIITKVSKSLRVVETSDGRKFFRRKQTGSWINNGTWSLVQGHHRERNPHI